MRDRARASTYGRYEGDRVFPTLIDHIPDFHDVLNSGVSFASIPKGMTTQCRNIMCSGTRSQS
jgi:hypothetical protein